jgi:chromosome partitioning protein
MRTIAIINMKGGVGKTTLSVNLGWYLARTKNRVLIVDLDPQFNASQYMMPFQKWDKHRKQKGTISDILKESVQEHQKEASEKPEWLFKELYNVEHHKDTKTGLWLIPSDLTLAKCVKNPQGVEYRLHRRMQYLDKYFDYAFIDCAPGDTVLTATALMASQYILVPIRPDRFSIVGYAMMHEVISNFRYDYPDPNKVQDLGVVFTQVRGKSVIETQCKEEVAQEAPYVFKTEIRASTSYLRSQFSQEPVFDTRYVRLITKISISSLVREMEKRISELSSTT